MVHLNLLLYTTILKINIRFEDINITIPIIIKCNSILLWQISAENSYYFYRYYDVWFYMFDKLASVTIYNLLNHQIIFIEIFKVFA